MIEGTITTGKRGTILRREFNFGWAHLYASSLATKGRDCSISCDPVAAAKGERAYAVRVLDRGRVAA